MYKRGRTASRGYTYRVRAASTSSSRSRTPAPLAAPPQDTFGGSASGGVRSGARPRRTNVGRTLVRMALNYDVPERKFILGSAINQALTLTPFVMCLNGVLRGDSVQQRDGDITRLQSLYARFSITPTTSTGTFQSAINRVMIVMDAESNCTQLTTGILLGAANPGFSALYNFNNYDFWKRFKVLFDKSYSFASTSDSCNVMEEIRVPLKHTRCDYAGGNAGDYSDIRSNAIWLLAWCNQTPASQIPLMQFQSVVRYTD